MRTYLDLPSHRAVNFPFHNNCIRKILPEVLAVESAGRQSLRYGDDIDADVLFETCSELFDNDEQSCNLRLEIDYQGPDSLWLRRGQEVSQAVLSKYFMC